MAFTSMSIASKKVTAPAYKHVEVLSIEIKTTRSTDHRKLRVTIIFLSKLEERKRKSQDDNIIFRFYHYRTFAQFIYRL